MKKQLLSVLLAAAVAAPAALNAEESVAHGYQMGDENNLFGFISFAVSQHATPTLDKRNYGETHISAGECVDGIYYTFEVYPDVMGGISAYNYRVRDAKTFDVITDIDFHDPTRRVVDMTYDYTTNTMFALVEDNVNTSTISLTSLNIVDLATGHCTPVGSPGDLTAINGNNKEVPEALITLAADKDGHLYAMGEYRQFYSLDKFSGAATMISTQQHGIATSNQFQSMAFDNEGVLYWAQTHPDYGYFLTIDPSTGVPEFMAPDPNPDTRWENEASKLGADAEVTGLWFEKAFAGTAPAAVGNLKAETVAGSPNSVSLTWELPTADLKGNPTSVTAVKVYRLGTSAPIATLAADATSYTDTAAPNGYTTYYVAAMTATEHGRGGLATVYTGADALMPVGSLTATIEGATVTLSWTAPTATYNGGYADFDNITYRVWRINGDKEEIIAQNVAETTYTDVLAAPATVYYSVEPFSCGVKGYAADSNPVTFKALSSIPYFTGFEDDGDGQLWKVINNHTNTSLGWSVLSGFAYQRYDGKFAQLKSGGSSDPCNDYLISPEIEFAPGTYEISYMVNGSVASDTHSWEIYLADGDTADAAKVTDIESHDNEKVGSAWIESTPVSFTVTAGGKYHIVLHGTTTATYCTLKIDNLSVVSLGKTGAALPYACDFEEGSDAADWTITNNNPHIQRSAGWQTATDATSPHGSNIMQLYVYGVSAGEYDDWLVSPAISFAEAGDYTLTFAAFGKSYDTHKWRVTLGTDASDTATFTNEIVAYDKARFTAWADYTVKFTVETPGTYHLGLHGQGCDAATRLSIDNIRVAAASTSGIEAIEADADAAEEYYNLQGVRIDNPAPGQIYIVNRGGKTAKVLVR